MVGRKIERGVIDVDRSLEFDYFYGAEAEQFSFIRLPKLLFRDRHFKGLSLEAKVVYGLLLDRMSLSTKNRWIDDENRVYIIYKVTSVAEDIGCSQDKAGRILSELDSIKGIGLIERKRRGLGRPDIIYVKNFVKFIDRHDDDRIHNENRENLSTETVNYDVSTPEFHEAKATDTDVEIDPGVDKSGENVDKTAGRSRKSYNTSSRDRELRLPDTADHDFKKPQNTISGDRNLRLQETAKYVPNKTDINNTDCNDTSSFPKVSSKPIKLVDNRNLMDGDEEDIRQIKENILYDWHMKTDRDPEKELYHELYEVIRDMVIGERETVTIGKATYPYSYVRERFLSLTYEHLEYVRNEVVKNQGKIYCLKKFIETALFNAPATINTHYSQLYTYYEEGDGRQLWDAG